MKDLKGKTAFVTGAASGIGRGLALVLAQQGCKLAIADLEPAPLEAVRAELEQRGAEVVALTLDVSDREAVYRAADETERAFDKVHIVCNNAGIGLRDTPLDQIADSDYDWAFGVVNGFKAFLPKIKKHGEGGHIVNTASMAGLHVMPGWHHGLYAATKMAVVALSEGFQEALAGSNIGVSVLCPAAVDSKIYRSGRVRPARFGGPYRAGTAAGGRGAAPRLAVGRAGGIGGGAGDQGQRILDSHSPHRPRLRQPPPPAPHGSIRPQRTRGQGAGLRQAARMTRQ